ncbi:MAG: SRPBCC family protein, partial [Actinobacteria bacterium]|nr:SRPBCC family protein [Actinomycetota bacterium]
MATIRSHARVHRTAEDVWKIVGDPTRIVEWFPGVTEATVEGTNRTLLL